DRVFDELRAVVGDHELHALGQGRLDLLPDRPLHALEHVVHALTEADDHHAAGGVALAVIVDDAAADVGADLHEAQVAHADGRAVGLRPHGHLLDVRGLLEVPTTAHHVLAAREFQNAPAHLLVAPPHLLDDFVDRDV